MNIETDVVIVGAGPGGTATSLYLARHGVRSVIVEKEAFPRYHIGESLTGEVGQRLADLGLAEYMATAAHPIKHGVNVYGPKGEHTFRVPVMKRATNGDLQAARTWQVPRDKFDQRLLQEAVKQGAQHIQGKAEGVLQDSGSVRGVVVKRSDGEQLRVHSKVLVDASGPATFAHSAGLTSRKYRGRYCKQVAIYSQVRGAVRNAGEERDNTLIFYRALNHWAWFIPLDEDRVSVGVVVPGEYFKQRGESSEDFLRRELGELNPELDRRTPDVDFAEEVRGTSNYSYAIDDYVGDGFLCVGDAHRFIDPIFSFGLHMALHEGELAASAIASHLASGLPMDVGTFREYQRVCDLGMNSIQDLVDAFWNNPLAFSHAAHYKYRDDIIDLFAGRIYEEEPSKGLLALRAINEKYREVNELR